MKKKICFVLAALLMTNPVSEIFAEEPEIENSVNLSEAAVSEEKETGEDSAEDGNVFNIYVNAKDISGENTYKSLTQAMAAANNIDKTQKQVIVNIKGGTYNIADTITFSKNESGSEKYPVIYRAAEGEQVIFNAGKKVSGALVDGSDTVKKRIPQSVRNKVYKIDLAGINVIENSFEDMFYLIYDGDMMPRATYPNSKWEFVSTVSGSEFSLENKSAPVASWDMTTGNGWMQYISNWGYDGLNKKLSGYNSQTGMVKLETRAVEANGRVRFVNMPELIDQPGEFCVDFANKCIYFYPPNEKFNKTAYVTAFKEPVIKFDGTSNVVLENIIVESGGGNGISLRSTDNVTLKNCVVRNFNGTGIEATSSHNTKITGCSVHHMGKHGIYFSYGGDYKTLTSSGNIIENTDVYTVGRSRPANFLGIVLDSETGTKISRCRVHDTPHDGIRFLTATNCTVEQCEIYNVVNDTYDAGGIYSNGGRYKGIGNIYKNNYFHDIQLSKSAKGGSVVALYWDDEQSGMTAEGNIFDNAAIGMLVGGGDDNKVNNNIFYNVRTAMTVDSRGESWSTSGRAGALEGYVSQYNNEVGSFGTALENTYPYITKFLNYCKENNVEKVQAPDEFTAVNNALINSGQITMASSVIKNALKIENNDKKKTDDFGFVDPGNYDFTYDENNGPSGFEYIDFSKIGIDDRELTKPKLLGPADGTTNIEGNNIVLSWADANGAGKYRVRIAMDKDMQKLIYDEVVVGTNLHLDNLKYGKIFYWSVETVRGSKSERGGYVSDIHSFSTSKSEIKDTSELDALLSSLGNGWKRVKEGKQPGMYREGAVDALDKVVTEAETILYDNASKMFTVKSVTAKLKNAILDFNDKMVYDIVDIGDWLEDNDNWVVKKECLDGKTLHMSLSDPDHPEANATYVGGQLSRGQLLRFKAKVDFTGYQMWGFNVGENETSGHAWESSGYSIVVFRNRWEVQKRYIQNGAMQVQILKTYANEESIMTSDVWHTIETGLLSTVMGPRIIVKVDGKTVVDYIDETEHIADQAGYFKFTEQSGGIGITVAPADYTEE